MKLDVSFRALEIQRERMGAPLRRWDVRITPEPPIPQVGGSLSGGEVTTLDDLGAGDGETILHGNLQVFLYIREMKKKMDVKNFEEICIDPDPLIRFHIVWCQKLKQMKAENKFERYVTSDRVDEPFGIVVPTRAGTWVCGDTELYVCRYCLEQTNWEGYRAATRNRKTEIVKGFSRRRFLETNHTRFAELPPETDKTPPAMGYAADWADRSRAYRQSVGFRCEDCGVDCSSNRSLLDTHHQNGVTTDNRLSNLRALCKTCHALRHPNWYIVSPQDQHALAALRAAQALGSAPRS